MGRWCQSILLGKIGRRGFRTGKALEVYAGEMSSGIPYCLRRAMSNDHDSEYHAACQCLKA